MLARERILIDWKETKIKQIKTNKQSYTMLQVLFSANVETRICFLLSGNLECRTWKFHACMA